MWHACLPALTLAPDLRTAGVLTLTTAALTALAALLLAGRRAAAATLPPRTRAEGALTHWLTRAWPWALAGLLAWGVGGWWLGTVANDALLGLDGATFLIDLTLPVAVAVTARARSAPRA